MVPGSDIHSRDGLKYYDRSLQRVQIYIEGFGCYKGETREEYPEIKGGKLVNIEEMLVMG